MSDWQIRLRDAVTLISPGLKFFNALWIGNERRIEKKVAIFNFPKFNKTVTQDLGVNGTIYPLTIFFEGPNNDKEAQRFEKAAKEIGRWRITHPTKGTLRLQPLSFTIVDNPVESGGVTEVRSEWLESVDIFSLASIGQLKALSFATSLLAKASSAGDYIANVSQATQAGIRAVSNTATSILGVITTPLSILASGSSEILGAFDFAVNNLQAQLAAPELDLQQISANIQSLIELPATVNSDFDSRFEIYKGVTDSILQFLPAGATVEDKNRVATTEIFLSAVLNTNSQIATSGEYKTRAQTIFAAESIDEQFGLIVDGLDSVQDLFKDNNIETQYYSQSTSFSDIYTLTYQAIAFSVRSTFDLPTEKRFTVQNPISPIALCIKEYGTLGENDSNFDLFIESNKLKNTELTLLPVGREIVTYG